MRRTACALARTAERFLRAIARRPSKIAFVFFRRVIAPFRSPGEAPTTPPSARATRLCRAHHYIQTTTTYLYAIAATAGRRTGRESTRPSTSRSGRACVGALLLNESVPVSPVIATRRPQAAFNNLLRFPWSMLMGYGLEPSENCFPLRTVDLKYPSLSLPKSRPITGIGASDTPLPSPSGRRRTRSRAAQPRRRRRQVVGRPPGPLRRRRRRGSLPPPRPLGGS